MRVLVSNSERHHAYQAALALQEAGALDRFVTGAYYRPGTAGTRAMEALFRLGGGRESADLARFRNRRQPGLPDERVDAIAWPELIERGWAKLRPLHRIAAPETMTFWKNDTFDRLAARRVRPGLDAVHAFEQCAEDQLVRARRIGAVAVLDEPIMHRGAIDRLEAQERDRLGVPMPPRPRGWQAHIDRKNRELDAADFLFTGLEFVRRSYVDVGFPEDRVLLVPYGVDLDESPSSVPVRPTRDRDGLRILYVGQISWWKGLPFLLDVVEHLDLPGAHLTVIGLPHPEWAEYFEQRFATMTAPVEYLARVPKVRMAQHLADADVLVFPSLVGGIGLVVYEAMAAGLPVITSDGDVVIRPDVDGLVAPYGDADAWTAALHALAADPDLRERIGAAGAQRARTFTWERYREGVREGHRTIQDQRT